MAELRKLTVERTPNNGQYFTIAIDGRGAAGKSSLAEYMAGLIPDYLFINGDDYFEPIDNQIFWGRFNDDRFNQDVINPINRKSWSFIYKPYNWHKEPHITSNQLHVKDGICIERGYSFLFDIDWDLKIWVTTPKDICFKRGIARETVPKARAERAWLEWQANEDSYIEDYQPDKKADVVIDGTRSFAGQLS